MFGLFLLGITLLVASVLLRPKPKTNNAEFNRDDTPTTISSRGSFIPVVIGRRRIGYVFGWAANREVRTEVVGTVSSKGKKKKAQTQKVYYESGWHQLCVGQGVRLYRITQQGKTIFDTELDPVTHPSGSSFEALNDEGTFRIYWGQVDQPIDGTLSVGTGVASKWPYLMYIVWDKKRLGTSANWPEIEYEVKVQCVNSQLTGVEPELGPAGQEGMNPVLALFQLMTGSYPFGCGLEADEIDLTTLNSVDSQMDTEDFGVNILFDGGMTGDTAISKIITEAGLMLVQNGDKLAFQVIREPSGTLPVMDNDVLLQPDIEYELGDEDNAADRLIFVYKGRDFNYRDVDVKIDNDGQSERRRRFKSQTIQMDTVTTVDAANLVASRRSQEEFGNKQRLRVQATRGFRAILVGDLIDLDGFGNVRIVSKSYNSKDAHATLELIPDTYGIPATGDNQGDVSGEDPALDPQPDIAFTFFELPASLSEGEIGIIVLRLRAHYQIDEAGIHLSGDGGSSYNLSGTETYYSQGGQIESALSASTSDIVETGPTFEDANGDAQYILDLSGDTTSWQNGRQIAVINDEVFYLRNVIVQAESSWIASNAYVLTDYVAPTTSTGLRYECTTAGTSGTTEPDWPIEPGETVTDGTVVWTARRPAYTLKGLIRAQLETQKGSHSIGDYVFIAEQNGLSQFNDPVLQAGRNVCVKTEPVSNGVVVDLSLVTAVCKDIVGYAIGSPSYIQDENGDFITTNLGQPIEVKES